MTYLRVSIAVLAAGLMIGCGKVHAQNGGATPWKDACAPDDGPCKVQLSMDRIGRLIEAQNAVGDYEAETIAGVAKCCIDHDPELAAYLRSRQAGWEKRARAIDKIKAEK